MTSRLAQRQAIAFRPADRAWGGHQEVPLDSMRICAHITRIYAHVKPSDHQNEAPRALPPRLTVTPIRNLLGDSWHSLRNVAMLLLHSMRRDGLKRGVVTLSLVEDKVSHCARD